MADHQKSHPVVADGEAQPTLNRVEAQPTTLPLVSRGLSNSEKGDNPVVQHPRSLPPFNVPVVPIHSNNPPKKPRSSCCCCKCLCWTISLLVLLLIVVGITCGILYLVFRPKLPNYSVDSLSISDLRLINFGMSLYAKFDVKITATNSNKKIGIYYEKGSQLSVWYSDTNLCQGTLPKFYQGHQNTTHLDVALTGQTQYASTLMTALQQQQQTGRIPLDLKIDVPVSVKLGKLKLRKVRVLGTCLLVVDSLSANSLISIKASTCKFGLKL
ncbi:unnamed protein product [Camellia sinensis]